MKIFADKSFCHSKKQMVAYGNEIKKFNQDGFWNYGTNEDMY